MIRYEVRGYQFGLLRQKLGSVLPAAAWIGLWPAVTAGILRYFFDTYPEVAAKLPLPGETEMSFFSTFTWVVGFILVFRTGQSYTRYWEGVTMLHKCEAEWYDACNMIIGFATSSQRDKEMTEAFTGTIVRLFSMLNAAALQQVCVMDDYRFHVIDARGLDDELCRILKRYELTGTQEERREKTEVIFQWLTRYVLQAVHDGIITTPAPIVTRAFQQMNSGMVALSHMLSITDTPFPFPYAQIITAFLLMYMMLVILLVPAVASHWVWASLFTFVAVSSQWAINLIAAEIEQPFGDDPNDFDLWETQDDWNASLLLMIDPVTNQVMPKPKAISNSNIARLSETLYQSLAETSIGLGSQKIERAMLQTQRTAPQHLMEIRENQAPLKSKKRGTNIPRWSYASHSSVGSSLKDRGTTNSRFSMANIWNATRTMTGLSQKSPSSSTSMVPTSGANSVGTESSGDPGSLQSSCSDESSSGRRYSARLNRRLSMHRKSMETKKTSDQSVTFEQDNAGNNSLSLQSEVGLLNTSMHSEVGWLNSSLQSDGFCNETSILSIAEEECENSEGLSSRKSMGAVSSRITLSPVDEHGNRQEMAVLADDIGKTPSAGRNTCPASLHDSRPNVQQPKGAETEAKTEEGKKDEVAGTSPSMASSPAQPQSKGATESHLPEDRTHSHGILKTSSNRKVSPAPSNSEPGPNASEPQEAPHSADPQHVVNSVQFLS
eukprot:gnl/MRDRNA2_/MRDRNA2_162393_c0_seq1.p1 gnl/MRDRNA2_/MRDRNA2_162393_c0~~gnl/MRDRNA2_/MRDRNA2_162393_c0_seq1.p1  ORF type:complete len:720 (-),score=103.08 gnl/MRDRNA2_/MRDRNA2_162393_c0_seq1:15-2174(-)